MDEQKLKNLHTHALAAAPDLLAWALSEGHENLKDRIAAQAALLAHTVQTLTVFLAAMGGAAAYAARLGGAPADPIGRGALLAAAYLMLLSALLVWKCLAAKASPSLHQEPGNLVAFDGGTLAEIQAGELVNLQERIDEQKAIVKHRAAWLNRLRYAALLAPVVFGAGVMTAIRAV
jgi:hypothetical protein